MRNALRVGQLKMLKESGGGIEPEANLQSTKQDWGGKGLGPDRPSNTAKMDSHFYIGGTSVAPANPSSLSGTAVTLTVYPRCCLSCFWK